MHILCNFNYPGLPVASYGANRSRITYPSPFDEHHNNTFELIIIWPPSRTLKVLLHPVPNAYVSLRFHRFCCILYSAAVSVVLAPTSTFVVALLLHRTAILEASCTLCAWCACITISLSLRRFSAQPPVNTLFASTPLLYLIIFCTQTCQCYN